MATTYNKNNTKKEKGYYSVSSHYRNTIPESISITWDDDYFFNTEDKESYESDIVAVFDYDYDLVIGFETQIRVVSNIGSLVISTCVFYFWFVTIEPLLIFIPLGWYVLYFTFLLLAQVRWETYAKHCAITRDGIRIVSDRRKSCWGLSCCDVGKSSKTIPFDKITDCDIHEPAGNTCLCIPNVLTTVIVDTASSGTEIKIHEGMVSGLKDPFAFKKLVWAMKRAKETGGSLFAYRAPNVVSTTKTTEVELSNITRKDIDDLEQAAADCTNNHEIPNLLRDIRDELKQNNELLR
eukprot:CAMPEP_0194177088 /NCGR_PEP_ID=MMETSP0154-20130528/10937_1 /TAXON_ID=1049557 /ORGANISM="Thalassiothrix antarctica, Strain L6-D1" /LENGTH=293 /DNA_ID=CAMNT_0038891563 /DNA_START=48 /DNA_END=925 /DNA_ORIENTATION=+